MKGYKVFNPDWTCRGFEYEVGKTYIHEGEIALCVSGFHFCGKLADCFNYYSFNPDNKVAEIETNGKVITGDDGKNVTDNITIVRELSWYEVLNLVNIGKGNTGYYNSGDYNSGDYNSGNRNSGNRNSGNRNSGDYNSGCFNTITPKITIFNKPSDWSYFDWDNSDAKMILFNMPNKLEWINYDEMASAEIENYPNAKTSGGYLRKLLNDDLKKARQEWWDNLRAEYKKIVKALPNFDADIFEECTMIRVEEK